ncbi:MAG: MoxR family ATPase [Anaerolineae bacterium]|nr:MAG: MoxR family ATPase [Anaerolineae bacterium]
MITVSELGRRIGENVERVIIGKHDEVQLILVGLLSGGHVLIEDLPGVGKTMLAKALARSLGCTFSRIQFTPDMLPSDVTGVSVFNQQTGQFEFRPGPVMAQIVLTDEINRATPKTQAALLEAMEETQVTVDGNTYPLAKPFLVLATQNPIEYEGTFPLPEAQLDRFFLRLRLGYPSPDHEVQVLEAQQYRHPVHSIGQVVTVEELQAAQEAVRGIYVDADLKAYIVELVASTRSHDDVYLGASPRGSLALYRGSQALAGLAGRDHVIPDDVKRLAVATLAHRLIIGPAARVRDVTQEAVVLGALDRVPVPGASVRRR